jgi:hypothetical protein
LHHSARMSAVALHRLCDTSIVPVTNPWLAGPAPRKRLDRSRLQERILNLLSSQNMCVLATVGPDGPLATPVRYYHLDFALMFTAAPGSPKMRNIATDPRVSIGVFALWSARPAAAALSSSATPPFSLPTIHSTVTTGRLFAGSPTMSNAHVPSTSPQPTPSWSWRPTASSTPSTGCAATAMPTSVLDQACRPLNGG